MKYNFLKSTLSSILKKKIRRISEILKDKPIKNNVLYSYLNFCIFTPPHLNIPALYSLPLALQQKQSRLWLSSIPSLDPFSCAATTLSPKERVAAQDKGEGGQRDKGVSFIAKLQSKGEGGCFATNGETLTPSTYVASPALNGKGLEGGRTKLSLNKNKGRKFGSFINYNKIIGYKFNSTFYQAYPALADTYKLLFYLFKSMYCLISKPVLKYTNDKVTIQLFYYLNIPKKKIFRLFSISYINSIKKKWLAQIEKKKTNFIYPSPTPALAGKGPLSPSEKPIFLAPPGTLVGKEGGVAKQRGRTFLPRGNTKIYIRWKLRKAISRFKNKIIPCLSSLLLPAKAGGDPKGGCFATNGEGTAVPKKGKNLFFKLRKFNLAKVYQNKFKLICAILSNKFNKPVELQLIRLHHPYHDSNILVNLLSLNIKNKRKKARVAIQKIYNKKPVKNLNDPNLKKPALPQATMAESKDLRVTTQARGTGYLTPAFLSGLNIKIAGRLMGEPIIPRITTKVFGKGASANGKVNYLDVARITKKNRKGAYTIKITSGQNFF
jgi:hypothetical protein